MRHNKPTTQKSNKHPQHNNFNCFYWNRFFFTGQLFFSFIIMVTCFDFCQFLSNLPYGNWNSFPRDHKIALLSARRAQCFCQACDSSRALLHQNVRFFCIKGPKIWFLSFLSSQYVVSVCATPLLNMHKTLALWRETRRLPHVIGLCHSLAMF